MRSEGWIKKHIKSYEARLKHCDEKGDEWTAMFWSGVIYGLEVVLGEE